MLKVKPKSLQRKQKTASFCPNKLVGSESKWGKCETKIKENKIELLSSHSRGLNPTLGTFLTLDNTCILKPYSSCCLNSWLELDLKE